MFSFAANLYTTLYMRLTNQRNRTMEKQAFYHMNINYQRALSFLAEDGSFRLFRNDWLACFVFLEYMERQTFNCFKLLLYVVKILTSFQFCQEIVRRRVWFLHQDSIHNLYKSNKTNKNNKGSNVEYLYFSGTLLPQVCG